MKVPELKLASRKRDDKGVCLMDTLCQRADDVCVDHFKAGREGCSFNRQLERSIAGKAIIILKEQVILFSDMKGRSVRRTTEIMTIDSSEGHSG